MGVLLSSKVCPKVKIFDFSADNVHQPDTNDMHTGATLDVGLLPESFTICSAFMVGAWTTRSTSAILTLLDDDGMKQGEIELFAASINTQYNVYLHSGVPCQASKSFVLPATLDSRVLIPGLHCTQVHSGGRCEAVGGGGVHQEIYCLVLGYDPPFRQRIPSGQN